MIFSILILNFFYADAAFHQKTVGRWENKGLKYFKSLEHTHSINNILIYNIINQIYSSSFFSGNVQRRDTKPEEFISFRNSLKEMDLDDILTILDFLQFLWMKNKKQIEWKIVCGESLLSGYFSGPSETQLIGTLIANR